MDGPSNKIVFLGIEIDTLAVNFSLSAAKCAQFLQLLQEFKTKSRISKRQLESLIGKLNWAAQVVQGGRTFLHRLFDIKGQLKRSQHKVRLDETCKADIEWW